MIVTIEKWCNHMEKVKVGPEVPCALQRTSGPNYKYFPRPFSHLGSCFYLFTCTVRVRVLSINSDTKTPIHKADVYR